MSFSLALSEAGVVKTRRRIKEIAPYLHLVPKPAGENKTVKHNANVYDTVKFIPQVVKATLNQSRQLARYLLDKDIKRTCQNIWKWIYDHIEYEKDESFLEQVRTTSRLVYDQKGDCDCYTTTINGLMENVRQMTGWAFQLVNRITKYGADHFQHIYPIVKLPNGERIVIDCVTEHFNYEEPYTEKKDFLMDLQLLNGIDRIAIQQNDFDGFDQEEDLGKLKDVIKKVGTAVKTAAQKTGEAVKTAAQKTGAAVKTAVQNTGKAATKAVHAINRVNPATVILRSGLLVAMKANALNIAGRIKWAYLTEEQAQKRGLNMDKYRQVKALREKLEKIFFGAGGKPENLREAILTGKGNKGKEVSGFGVIPIYAMRSEGLTARDILGDELYQSETAGLTGLDAAFVMPAAVTAAIATIAAALQKIGAIMPGESESDDPDAASATVSPDEASPSDDPAAGSDASGARNRNARNGEEIKFTEDPGGWIKENPGKTAAAAITICAVGYGVYKMTRKKKEAETVGALPPTRKARQLSGATRQQYSPVMLED